MFSILVKNGPNGSQEPCVNGFLLEPFMTCNNSSGQLCEWNCHYCEKTHYQDVKIFRLAPKSLCFRKYSTFFLFFFLAVNQSAKSETLSLQSSTHSSRSNTLERPSKPNKDSGLQPRLPTHEVCFFRF